MKDIEIRIQDIDEELKRMAKSDRRRIERKMNLIIQRTALLKQKAVQEERLRSAFR